MTETRDQAGGTTPGGEWTKLGPPTRLGCPYCPVEVDEPPIEVSVGDSLTWGIRQNSALPGLAAHVLEDHPESETADVVRAAITEHGSIQEAVRVELAERLRAVMPGSDKSAAADWHCEAYGSDPEVLAAGARCFFAEPGLRACKTAAECGESMAAERQRVFARIQEMAAAGDPTGVMLAEEFTRPEQLLGGPECDPAPTLVEAVRKASTEPSWGVARLECPPDVVEYLIALGLESPPSPAWKPAPIVPVQNIPVQVDESMPVGRWRMVTAAGDVVWEGTVER